MTPTLFDLPIRAPQAAELGVLILEQIGERPITPEVRNRIVSRSVLLKLEGIVPYFGSLERDPIHGSAVYIAVDGIDAQPLLLRIAPNGTPASGLYPKSILIGRVPGPGGTELVMNAVPFSPVDTAQIRTFASEVNKAFLPKPAGNRSAILIDSSHPAAVYPEAFTAFRTILTERNLNLAGFTEPATATWAAIRAGWRDGYIVRTPELEREKEIVPAGQLTGKQRAICTLRIDAPDQAATLIQKCSPYLL